MVGIRITIIVKKAFLIDIDLPMNQIWNLLFIIQAKPKNFNWQMVKDFCAIRRVFSVSINA